MEKENDNINCPYCLSPISEHEENICCPGCGTAYHAECWQVSGKCLMNGCEGWQTWNEQTSQMIAPMIKAEIDIEDAEIEPPTPPTQEPLRCIECGERVKRGQVLCWSCRIKSFRLNYLENCATISVILLATLIALAYLLLR